MMGAPREKNIRLAHTTIALIALMSTVGFVYYLGFLYMYGSAAPSPARTEPLNQFGYAVYITIVQKEWFTRLRLILVVSLVLLIASTVVVQNIMGIRLGAPPSGSRPESEGETPWKTVVRKTYTYGLRTVLFAAAISFCYFIVLTLTGSPTPTALSTEPLWSHGHAVYVRVIHKRLLNLLWMFFAGGIPVLAVLGLFLHFAARAQTFSRGGSK